METLPAEDRQLRKDVLGMRLDAKEASVKSTVVNPAVQEKGDGGSVPLRTLMVLERSLNGKRVKGA